MAEEEKLPENVPEAQTEKKPEKKLNWKKTTVLYLHDIIFLPVHYLCCVPAGVSDRDRIRYIHEPDTFGW